MANARLDTQNLDMQSNQQASVADSTDDYALKVTNYFQGGATPQVLLPKLQSQGLSFMSSKGRTSTYI